MTKQAKRHLRSSQRMCQNGSLLILVVILLSHLDLVSNANILVVYPIPSKSHFKSYQPLFEELVRRGHNLTIISFEKLSKNLNQNYTHIDVSHLTVEKLGIKFAELRKLNRLDNVIYYDQVLMAHIEMVMVEPSVKNLLRSKDTKFDLVMIEMYHMDVYVAFGNHFKAPVIALSAQAMISFYKWISENPLSPSYIPNSLLPFTDKMKFSDRLWNACFTFTLSLYYEYVSLPRSQKVMEKYFHFRDDEGIPRVKDMMKNISLILGNSHFTFGYPAPFLPNFIEVAGLHITEPDPLADDIQKFMDDATQGVIYICMGSVIQPHDLDEMGKTFMNVLKRLPQKIIFKWNPELLSSIPRNVLVKKWTPQNSILSHRNCRLFITHGGLHSLLESIHYSVPLIGIPFFSDQYHNIALVEYLGIGKGLHFSFTEDQLFEAIQELLSNPKYSENIKLQSSKFNDRIASPLNIAVYWVEYVLRHKQFLRPTSADLPLYQDLLLDVLIVMLLIILLTLLLFYLILKTVFFYIRPIFCSKIDPKTSKNIKVQ